MSGQTYLGRRRRCAVRYEEPKVASVTATSDGRITLPAKLLEQLGVMRGDRVDFDRNEDGSIQMMDRDGAAVAAAASQK